MRLLPKDHDDTPHLERPFFGYLKGNGKQGFHEALEDYLNKYCSFTKGKDHLTKEQLENYQLIYNQRREGFYVKNHKGAKSYEGQILFKDNEGKEYFSSIRPTKGSPYRYPCATQAHDMLRLCYPTIANEDWQIVGVKDAPNMPAR